MANTTENDKSPQTPSAADAEIARIRRRRLFIGGIGAAPVAMTLPSRALAGYCATGGTTVFTPSMVTSANLSGSNKSQVSAGRSPGYWKNHTSEWPGSYPTTKAFAAVFGSNQSKWTMLASTRPNLLDVISPNKYGNSGNGVVNGDGTSFARACVSSLLNAATGKYKDGTGNWLSTSTIIAMYQGGIGTGWPVPGTGVIWNMAQIQNYLVNTWDIAYGCTV